MKKIFSLILLLFFITSNNLKPLEATNDFTKNSFTSLFLGIGSCLAGISNLGEIWLGSNNNPFKLNLFKSIVTIDETKQKTVVSLLPSFGYKTKTHDLSNNKITNQTKLGFWLQNKNSTIKTKLGCSLLPVALVCYGLKQLNDLIKSL